MAKRKKKKSKKGIAKNRVKKGRKTMDKQAVSDAMEEILVAVDGCHRFRTFRERVFNERFSDQDLTAFNAFYAEIISESLADESGTAKFHVMRLVGRQWICLND